MLALLAAAFVAPAAQAATAPVSGARPAATAAAVTAAAATFDARDAARRAADLAPAQPGSAAQRSARTRLAGALGPQAVVATDPVTGTVSRLQRLDGALSAPTTGDPTAVARAYLAAHAAALGLSSADVDGLRADGVEPGTSVEVVRFGQQVGGIPTWDSGLRVALATDGRVLSVTGAPVPGLQLASTSPLVGAQDAARAVLGPAARATGRPQGAQQRTALAGGGTAGLTVLTGAGAPTLAWSVLAQDATGDLTSTLVDATSGAVLLRQGLTKHLSGPLYPDHPGAEQDPDPAKAAANAPLSLDFQALGWLGAGAPTLDGPSVHAYSDLNDNNAVDAGEEVSPAAGTSDFGVALVTYNPPPGFLDACGAGNPQALEAITEPCTWSGGSGTWQANRAQTTVQAFYLANTFAEHLAQAPIAFSDFTGSQAIRLETDDGANLNGGNPDLAHVNNANMTVPPAGSGQAPRLQTYLQRYRSSTPAATRLRNVNGSDAAAVVWHEMTHGLSQRLVTYDSGVSALSSVQGGALGEAWSDWYALDELVRRGLEVDDQGLSGDVTYGSPIEAVRGAVRTEGLDCPVGPDPGRCPGSATAGAGGYTYGDLGRVAATGPEVHADGEIWGQFLWDVRTALVARQGSQEAGARLAERLVTDAMRITPPEPTFLDARNAMLAAATAIDPALRDVVWSAAAARGMGFYAGSVDGADRSPVESFALPPADGAAQGTLAGTVTDRTSGLPIAGVTVSLAGLTSNAPYGGRGLSATTAADGTWSLAVPPGRYGTLLFAADPVHSDAVQHDVTVVAGQTQTIAQTLPRDWAAAAGRASVASSDATAAGVGCGADRLLDHVGASGWSTTKPEAGEAPDQATITLPRAITLQDVAIDPAAVCGDAAAAGLKDVRVEAVGTDGSVTTVATTSLPASAAGAPQPLTLDTAPAGLVQQVRVVLLSSQGTSSYIDLADVEVHGAPPNTLPSGGLVASPGTVAPGATVRLAASFTDPDSRIAGYAWDVDGNGSVDRTTADPTLDWTYTGAGRFTARVSAQDVRGGDGVATATVDVVAPPAPTTSTPTPTTPAPGPGPGPAPGGTLTGSTVTTTTPRTTTAAEPPTLPATPELSAVKSGKKGRAEVTVTCPAACTFTAKATVTKAVATKIGRRPRTVLTFRAAFKSGRAKVTLIVPKSVLAPAKRKGLRKLPASLTLSVVTRAGLKAARTAPVTFFVR